MTKITKLLPGQYVTTDKCRHAYRVETVRSSVLLENFKTKTTSYMRDPEASHQRALDLGHPVAWTINPGSAIVAHDNSAELEMQRRADAEASTLVDGDKVEIEGVVYTVRDNGDRFSDPIGFSA